MAAVYLCMYVKLLVPLQVTLLSRFARSVCSFFVDAVWTVIESRYLVYLMECSKYLKIHRDLRFTRWDYFDVPSSDRHRSIYH